jgi:hypothetical protein
VSLAAISACAALCASAHVSAQSKTASLYVRAVDAAGAPVADLRPTEMQLTVDGKPGKISLVTYLGGPRRVMLLVSNNSQLELNPMREGLEQFVTGIPSDDEIGLGTTSGQYHPRVELSTDRSRLLEFVKTLPVEDGNNTNMDGLVEVYKRFLEKEQREPVIVVVTTEGSEASSVRDEVFNKFVQDYAARGGITHVVLVSIAAGGAPPRPTASPSRTRPDNAILSYDTDAESIVTMNITKSTGGDYQIVNAVTAIPEKLKEIAADIKADESLTAGWYKVVFAADKPPNAVRFQISRPDTKFGLSQVRPHR